MSQSHEQTANLSSQEKRALLEQLLRKKARYSTPFPLSFAQERLWFLHQLEPNSPYYNVPVAVRLTGQLNTQVLRKTFNEIINRHEVLRTSFPAVNGKPVQIISAPKAVALPIVDLSRLPEHQRETEAQRLVHDEAHYCFNIASDPPVRLRLLRLQDEEHIAIFNMHHIVSDGWSMGIFINEIAVLYNAFLKGEPSPLPDLTIQYADYAAWQREWLQGEVIEEQLAHCRQRLGGSVPVLELPIDKPRPAIQRYEGAYQSIEMEESLSEQIRQLSKQEGVTLFMLLLGAFKVLLYRYTQQRDIVVGVPVAGRHRAELEPLIGFFVNTVLCRSELVGGESFALLVRGERREVVSAMGHDEVPFEMLVDELQPQRSLSYSPIFQVMFVLEGSPQKELRLPGLKVEPFDFNLRISKFDLTLSITNAPKIAATLEYNTDLFEAATITRMLGHFRSLLQGACADPEQPISSLQLLTDAERRRQLVEWNDTAIKYSYDTCIHHLFEDQVERTPDAVAAAFEQEHLDYAELNRRANQLAHYLMGIGVGPEVPVGVCIERSLEMVVAILAILKAGGAYVPLDLQYPKERLTFIIKDARLAVLLTRRGALREADHHGTRVINLDEEWEEVAGQSTENPASGVEAKNLAYVIYTSGSTGRPKGVMVAHRSICNRLLWGQHTYPLTASDSGLQLSSTSFDVSVLELFAPLIAGARLVIASPYGAKDTAYLVGLMKGQKVTAAQFTPSLLQVLLDEGGIEKCEDLREVLVGGEPLQSKIRDSFFARLDAKLYNFYGPTETSVDATYWACKPDGRQGIVPIGRPLANVQTYILDAYLQAVPIGVRGELYVAGEGLARGYLGRADLTAENFIPDPFSHKPGARMYRTGDIVRYLPDGSIDFVRRIDNQVKVRGFRIELEEIEAALAHYPGLAGAVVLAREVSPSDNRLVAYIVCHPGQAPNVSRVRASLREKVPEYMVPSSFVAIESLPLTPNGKVDRRALLSLNRIDPDPEQGFAAPRDLFELRLIHLWGEILGVRHFGIRDNFFDLGGHSLLAVRLMSRIKQAFGKELPVTALFQAGTVEHLAVILREQGEAPAWSPLVAIQTGDRKRPFFCVHPASGNVLCYFDLAQHLGPDQPFYAFAARGGSSAPPPPTSIEEMASHYIKAMREIEPGGPYLLGGWSLGGMIAFEMARQLETGCGEVALLALIDAPAPTRNGFASRVERDNLSLAIEFGYNLGLPLDRLSVSREEFLGLELEEQLSLLLEKARRADIFPADINLYQIRHLFDVFKAIVTAADSYAPKRTKCHTVLLKAGQRVGEAVGGLSMGWDGLVEDGVAVIEVAGNHFSMVREPDVRVLAERLKECINGVFTP